MDNHDERVPLNCNRPWKSWWIFPNEGNW